MGQEMNKNNGKEPTEGKHAFHQPVKNRYGAKFGNEHDVNPLYGKGGKGAKQSNPGRPI